MKKILSLTVALSSAILLSGQSRWQLTQLAFPEELNCVQRTPNAMICIGGELGDIYRTDTSLILNSTLPGNMEGIADITFHQNNEGWAVGEDGLILKSTDSGQSWTTVPSGTTSSLEAITFLDQDSAFIVGRDGTILRSINGGNTWSSITSGTTERLEGVAFSNILRGFVVGREGVFLETTDGGDTWASNSIGPDDNKDVVFVDNNTGFVTGANGLFRTTDGGNTWSVVVTSNTAEFEALAFMNTGGLAVGEDGLIYSTSDGGLSWTKDTSFTAMLGLELTDVTFLDTLGAIAVGEAGYIAYLINTSNSGNVSSLEHRNPMVDFYPNPANQKLNIVTPTGLKINEVLLINEFGVRFECPRTDENILNLNSIPNGIYFMKLTNEQGLIAGNRKLVVIH